jgi:rSAM/selenodomain-associated transferase 1
MKSVRIVIMAKAPVAGYAKTRLIPALGSEGAAALAHRMLLHTVETAISAQLGPVEICVAPGPEATVWRSVKPEGFAPALAWTAQGDGDLGEKMARVAQRVTTQGEAVILIGTDCPAITREHLLTAAAALCDSDAVMIPTADGGYALLALKQFHPTLFSDIAWSTETVAATTRARLNELGWHLTQMPPLRDIDTPEDLRCLPPAWVRWIKGAST